MTKNTILSPTAVELGETGPVPATISTAWPEPTTADYVHAVERDIHAILADIEGELRQFADTATTKARALLVELRKAL